MTKRRTPPASGEDGPIPDLEGDGASRRPDGALVADYDYELPSQRIAQYPAERRDESRLLVLAADGSLRHRKVTDLVELLEPGDALVVNESAVFPARLLGRKPTGAEAEVLLVRPLPHRREAGERSPDAKELEHRFPSEGGAEKGGGVGSGYPGSEADVRVWEALVRPGGKLKPGREVVVGPDLTVEIVDTLESGSRVVRLVSDLPVEEALDRYGHVPLPPYIDRSDEPVDRERYQTVYARDRGSVAAPTAGLHFTDDLLGRIEAKGVRRVAVTLHVGVGTFRPVDVDDPAEHQMHREWYSVSPAAAEAVNRTRREGGRIWAVGTTAVRTLESAADQEGRLHAGSGETGLFIRPPYDFRLVDGLVTNFHLPRSTLLMLVAALAGYQRTMDAYRVAVDAGYRFYSYGDAMVLEPAG